MPDIDQPSSDPIPSLPGTYALVLHLASTSEIEVGKLGRSAYPAGFYIYVGSALGSGGLAGRLKHHRKSTTSPGWRARWHIDYFRHYAKLVGIWYVQQAIRREHDWAITARQLSGASISIPRFGSSDCSCPSHLFHFSFLPRWNHFRKEMVRSYPGDDLVAVDGRLL
jgi:Uri superfamily endonuclease